MLKNNMRIKKIYDISWELTENTVIYPGNPPIKLEVTKNLKSSTQLTEIRIGSHTGTHLDAPLHVNPSGAGVEAFDIEHFIGDARVLDCTIETRAVTVQTLEKYKIKKDERILLKTKNSSRLSEPFFSNFIFLSPEGAEYLARLEVKLVGIDYLSIKEKGSADNRPHTLLLEKYIPILEGVDLSQVPAGDYFMFAPPLKFKEIDGSPLRAVLLSV